MTVEENEDASDHGFKAVDISGNGHNSLKYHLLGPSLTKAGQDSVDQQKVGYGSR